MAITRTATVKDVYSTSTETTRTESKLSTKTSKYVDGTDDNDVLFGNFGDNFLYGNGGDDTLMGDLGADELHGSNGIDTADYRNSSGPVRIDLAAGTGKGGDAQGDRLVSIENATGSSYGDWLYGDDDNAETAGANVLDGRAGDDELYGRGGDDTLLGGTGDDLLEGGEGADHLDGGSDFDTVSYASSSEGVTVNIGDDGAKQVLASFGSYAGGYTWIDPGLAKGGDAEGDSFSSIEGVIGSAHDDFIFGNDADNVIEGGNGNDQLQGGLGDDTLIGGGDDDWLVGNEGADHLDGGEGFDFAVYLDSFDAAPDNGVGVIVDLHMGQAEGLAAGDTFESVEGVLGTKWSDVLIGDGNDNVLVGFAGDDRLEGDSGLGPSSYDFDELIGGFGNDILFGGYGDAVLTGGNGYQGVDAQSTDTFVFADQSDVDTTVTVTDFDSNDLLDFRSFTAFETAQEIIDQFEQAGSDAVFQSGLTEVVLENFSVSDLQVDDFVM